MADLKEIRVPESLKLQTVLNKETGERQEVEFSFVQFIQYLLDSQKSFNDTATGIRASIRIMNKVTDVSIGEKIILDNEDYELLVRASENPDGGYPLQPSRNLLSFLDAIKPAKSSE